MPLTKKEKKQLQEFIKDLIEKNQKTTVASTAPSDFYTSFSTFLSFSVNAKEMELKNINTENTASDLNSSVTSDSQSTTSNTRLTNLEDFLESIYLLKCFTNEQFLEITNLELASGSFFDNVILDSQETFNHKVYLIAQKIITFDTIKDMANDTYHPLLNPVAIERMAKNETTLENEIGLAQSIKEKAKEEALKKAIEQQLAFQKQISLANSICIGRFVNGINNQINRIKKNRFYGDEEKIFQLEQFALPLNNNQNLKTTLYSNFKMTYKDTIRDLLNIMNVNRKLPVFETTSYKATIKLQATLDHDYLSMTQRHIPGFAQTVTLSELIKDNITLNAPALGNCIEPFFANSSFKINRASTDNGKIILSSMILRTCLKDIAKHPNYQSVLNRLNVHETTITPKTVKVGWQAITDCLVHYDMYIGDKQTEKVSLKSAALISVIKTQAKKNPPNEMLTDADKVTLIQLMHQCHHYYWWINHQNPAQKTCSHIINTLYGIESSEDCHELYMDIMRLSKVALEAKLHTDFPNALARVKLTPSSSRANSISSMSSTDSMNSAYQNKNHEKTRLLNNQLDNIKTNRYKRKKGHINSLENE